MQWTGILNNEVVENRGSMQVALFNRRLNTFRKSANLHLQYTHVSSWTQGILNMIISLEIMPAGLLREENQNCL